MKSPLNKKTTNNTRGNILGTRLLEYLEDAHVLKRITPKKSEIASGIVSGILTWGVNREDIKVKVAVLPNDSKVIIPVEDRFSEEERIVWIRSIGKKYTVMKYAKVLRYNNTSQYDTKMLEYLGGDRDAKPMKVDIHSYTVKLPSNKSSRPMQVRDIINIVEMNKVPVLEGWSSVNDVLAERIQKDNPDLYVRW